LKQYFYTSVFASRNKAYVRGFADGKRFNDDLELKPYLFLEGKGPYLTLDGKACYKKQFETIKEARDFIQRYEGIDNFNYYGMTNYIYPFINDSFPGEISYDPDLIRVDYLDIEVYSGAGFPLPQNAIHEITAICLIRENKTFLFGVKPYKPKRPDVIYYLCHNEADLLEKFLDVWSDDYPDTVSGWNSDMFDWPYLINRMINVLGERSVKVLSPWKIINEREIIRAKGTTHGSNIEKRTDLVFEIAGISQLDYLQLYKKFTNVNHESYRLDNIAQYELNERKLDYSNFNGLEDLYQKDPERYYDYNIHDTVLVKKLDDKMGFIRQIVALAYKAKINYMDAFTTTKPWDVIIHNYLLERNLVIPQQKRAVERELIGAYVHDVQPGLHKHVVSFDFKSLYPSIISQSNISPETFVSNNVVIPSTDDIIKSKHIGDTEHLIKTKDWTVCANRCAFTKKFRGFIPEIVDKYIADRDAIKKRMLQLQRDNIAKNDKEVEKTIRQLGSMEQSLKILSNGLYGALANVYFRWFDINLAEAVTTTGQLYILWVMARINEYLNSVVKDDRDWCVAGDTDSLFLALDPIVQKMGDMDKNQIILFLDKLCQQKIEPTIANACKQLGQILNSYNNVIIAKREILADKAIWRKKKNYILNVWDKEGVRYDEPKLILKGIEAVRSSTPRICRDNFKEALKLILKGDEANLQTFVVKFKDQFMNLPFGDIAFPKSVDGIQHYYDPVTLFKKSTPFHVRGSIVYNEFLKTIKETRNFKMIKNKDKTRTVYLKEPNPIKSYVISVPDEGNLPKQFDNVIPFIDKDLQWEKTFIGPLKSITDLIGWDLEKRTKIDAFFV